jgi:hypothetical protein
MYDSAYKLVFLFPPYPAHKDEEELSRSLEKPFFLLRLLRALTVRELECGAVPNKLTLLKI